MSNPPQSYRVAELAGEVGFCFGVRRAISLTREALRQGQPVYIFGDLVHNRSVTQDLESQGLKKVSSLDGLEPGTMVVRAHGLPLQELTDVRDRGFRVVDATCPIVHRAQEAAKMLEDRGCQVVIVGDHRHAEIKGIIGCLSRPAVVIDSIEGLRDAAASHVLKRKVGVVFQTTHSLELCRHIVSELVLLCKEVQIVNTICRPVQSRQYAAAELAKRVDLMLVVGSSTSANTIEMAALCRVHNPWTRHIETAADLREEDLIWAGRIGIASGLSTPVECVEQVRATVLAYPKPPDPSLRPSPLVCGDEPHELR